jgi:putative ABC transport system permease protein
MPEVNPRDWKELVRQQLTGASLSPARETEIVEEVSQHLADRYQELVASGATEDTAYQTTASELSAHELIQQLRRVEAAPVELPTLGTQSRGYWLGAIWYDLRYAIRLLRLNPTFTVVAIVSLALGIGANTAIFQLVNAVRLRTLPVKDPQELALIKLETSGNGRTGEFRGVSTQNTYPQFQQIRDRSEAFSGLAAWGSDTFDLNSGGEMRYARGIYVNGDYFNVLGVAPAAGRFFSASDDVRGCGSPGVVISYPFWRTEYGQNPNAIGLKLSLDGHPFTIVGVSPPGFFGIEVGRSFDVAIPICAEPIMRSEYSSVDKLDHWWIAAVGRLKPGWTVEKATAQLKSISASVMQDTLPSQYTPETKKAYLAYQIIAVPGDTGTSYLRKMYSEPLTLLLAITGLVLLIACANLANLMLARASAREREIAIRLALGAARGRLIRQLLTESLLVAVIGAAVGLLIAYNVSHVLVGFLNTDSRPIFVDLSLDWRMFVFTAGLAIATCVLFGLAPALRATRVAPSRAMSGSGRSVISSRERNRLRRGLVVTQVALSLVLLIAALLFTRSLSNLLNMDAGFRRDGIMVIDVDMSRLKLASNQRSDYKEDLLQRIRLLPGVQSAAQTNIVPITGSGWNENILISDQKAGVSNFLQVSPGFFSTMELPILLGRDFNDADSLNAPKVAIVNQWFAEKMLKTAHPIGMTFGTHSYDDKPPVVFQVVGLVKNMKYQDLRDEFDAVAFVPASQDERPDAAPSYLIRTSIPMESLTAEVKEAVRQVSPTISLSFRVFQRQINESLARERMLATLSGFFGILAGVLAVVGIYGVISYMVIRRSNEIGVRMALGANRIDILRLILREAGVLLGIGLMVGTALAFVAARWSSSLLYGLKATDVTTYTGAILMLTCVTVAASFLPARRASRLDPMVALRDE